MPNLSAHDLNADGPYNLLCSSLPLELQPPIHAVESDPASGEPGCQAESAPPFIHDVFHGADIEQSAGATPQSPPYIAPGFNTIGKFSPVFEIYGMTALQLAPPRRPIPQKGPLNTNRIYSHPRMTPENAALGIIPAYTTDYTGKADGIPGWKEFCHPRGTIYFHHAEKNVVTNVNIFNKDNLTYVEETIAQVFLRVDHDADMPRDKQLVIDMQQGERRVGYYFASLHRRCLFWTKEGIIELPECSPNLQSYTHIEPDQVICMNNNSGKAFYLHAYPSPKRSYSRYHYQQFPHVQTSSLQLVREAKGLLAFLAAERIFDGKTVVSWNAEEIDTMTSIIHSVPDEVMEEKGDACFEAAHYRYVAGGLMFFYAIHKFRNYHGLPNARYLRDQFMFEDTGVHSRMNVIPLISPALFYTPTKYLRLLETIISEKMIFFEAWRKFVTELHQEWNGLAIFATVLLATNVAFLAIPSVDNGDHPEKRSAAQICSYFSIVLSVGSVALGQIISRYHRIKGLEYLDERVTDNAEILLDIGCHRLAIIYSLPYAMLCWSVIAFLVAFLIMCFDGTTILVRCLIGVTSAILVLVVVYCIYIMHNNTKEWSAKSLLSWFMRRRFSPRASIPRTDPDPVELQNHPLSWPPFVQVVQVADA